MCDARSVSPVGVTAVSRDKTLCNQRRVADSQAGAVVTVLHLASKFAAMQMCHTNWHLQVPAIAHNCNHVAMHVHVLATCRVMLHDAWP